MIEARCGRLCSNCGYFEKCGGCVNRDKPVWAARCPVKSCCEEKSSNTAVCAADSPAGNWVKFAKDKDYGDGGLRIGQCRAWKEIGEDAVYEE